MKELGRRAGCNLGRLRVSMLLLRRGGRLERTAEDVRLALGLFKLRLVLLPDVGRGHILMDGRLLEW